MINEYHADFEYSPPTSCSDAKEDKKTMEAKAQSNLLPSSNVHETRVVNHFDNLPFKLGLHFLECLHQVRLT
jgi:hypothetical protein